MTTATATEQTVDLEALEEDAKRTLGELTEARARLALDALTDATVAAELEAVESEMRSCQDALERAQLAHGEQGRRAAAAAAEAAREARERAMERAQALQADRERAAVAVDEALGELARSVGAWLSTCDAQDVALEQSGRRPVAVHARGRALALEAAFAFAMRPMPRGILQLEGPVSPRHVVPLGQGDMRPVEPLQEQSGRANQQNRKDISNG
jgi:hypothetical protein